MKRATLRGEQFKRWWKTHRKQVCIGVPIGLIGIIVLVQLFYPANRMVPFQTIDTLAVGGWQKEDAAWELHHQLEQRKVNVLFGKQEQVKYAPTLGQLGIEANYQPALDEANYPWYWRIVPSSLAWMHLLHNDTPEPSYQRDEAKLAEYMKKELGGSCQVAPTNATAKATDTAIEVVADINGGTCKEDEVRSALAEVKPVLSTDAEVRIAMQETPAALRTNDVRPIVEKMNTTLQKDIIMTYDDAKLAVASKDVRSWLQFSTEENKLHIAFNDKANAYLTEKLEKPITRPAGVSKVTTKDFVEVSRADGVTGRALNVAGTLDTVRQYLLGETNAVPVATTDIAPKVEYTRQYSHSDRGLSALMQHFAEDNDGVYGVSLVELDGQRRRASYQDDRKFTTASTYKLYVAYSTLKRVESGEMKWGDQISGSRDLAKCFDDMIVQSDNACAEALVAKIGYRPLTVDAQSIVSANTTFLDTESYKTTAGDLSTFMASLATGQISLSKASQDRFVGALKRNVYRQGIPAGASGKVADKVGFLEGFLHDAAIVYSPSGTYALSIMTDGSSWANIAKLTKEIEKLR
ncbi:MAG: serine hydrolase [Candidatus Saccharimonadales bacterium]